jgi:site-specific DNA-methyltransferase (adenine-specific)
MSVGMLGPYPLDSIITGDARELAQAIPDASVDLVLTDPPFGIGFDYGNGYKDDYATYQDLLTWMVDESERVIKPEGFIAIFQSLEWARVLWNMRPNARMFAACKNFVQMGRNPVPWGFGPARAFDPVIFWSKSQVPTIGRDWHVGNTANTNNRGMNEAGFHACPRPLDTVSYMVQNWSEPGGIVVDWFAGSGTTCVAARILERRYLAFEIDPATAAKARARVANTLPLLDDLAMTLAPVGLFDEVLV